MKLRGWLFRRALRWIERRVQSDRLYSWLYPRDYAPRMKEGGGW